MPVRPYRFGWSKKSQMNQTTIMKTKIDEVNEQGTWNGRLPGDYRLVARCGSLFDSSKAWE
jgi:hypothetical protein